ncbi:BnaAnng13960D [Brassica napus]|uniref:BnaAnng13960D protein n=1 Tax=Brassica napus TaxID=3708 RepID=A0A078IW80_BRANA|nr:BnaAnng13960D [Brassica napus]
MNGGFQENTNWIFQEVKDAMWTVEENKLFEKALAVLGDKDDLESWSNIAALIPGKSVDDVIKRYKKLEDDISDIEAGLVPDPGYCSDASAGDYFFGLENSGYERKKGVPWTEEEHRRFLMGLKKYGKGDWRNIARNFVTTRTPTQVASHAQKYFIRQLTDCKDKRRSSIHDITTVNVPDAKALATATPAAATVSPTPTNPFDVYFPPKPHHSLAFSPASSYHNAFPQWS